MLVRYQNSFREYNLQGSYENQRTHLDESMVCNEECVDLIDGPSKDMEKSRHINTRQSKRNVGEKDRSSFSTQALEYRSNNDMRLRPLAPKIPSEQGVHYSESQTSDRKSLGQASSRRASLPGNLLSSAIVSHSISDLSPEHNREASSIAELLTGPQLYGGMNDSAQHMRKEMKLDAPVPGVQKSQDAINLMKRPAEGSSALRKKSRKTKSHNDVEELDPDRDYYSSIDEAQRKKEEQFACPFYRKDPLRFLECINVKMVTISIVKQHLKRRHAAADWHCPVCNTGFPSSKLFEGHEQEGSCSHSRISTLDSIPTHIMDALRSRSLTQWHEIWGLLFGKSDTTPNPLLGGIAKEMTGIIRDIWTQDGSQIVANYVQARGLPASSAEMSSSLLELLDRVEDRFETTPLLGESVEQLADIKKPVIETNIGERGESRQDSAALAPYPYQGFNLSDFAPTATSAFRTSDSLKPVSVTADPYDLQSVGAAFEPWEICFDFTASSFPAYTEPLLCLAALDFTDDPYDIFKQNPSSQMASSTIDQDWGLSDDYSLNILEE